MENSFRWPDFGLKKFHPGWYPAIAALLLAAACAWAFAYFGYDPVWALVLIIIGILIPLALRRWPVEILACLLFVGNFKNTPARGISLTDPTMLLLLLSAAAIALDFLFVASGATRWSLRGLLSGQGAVIGVFLVFIATLGVSALYSSAPEVASSKIARILVFDVIMFLAPFLLLKDQRCMQRTLTAVILLSLALAVKEVMRADNPSQKVMAGEADVTYIGDGIAFATAIVISLYQRVWTWRWLTWGCLAALTVGLITSAARGPVLGLLLTLALTAMVTRHRQFVSRKKLLLGALTVLLIAIGAYQWIENNPAMEKRVEFKQEEFLTVISGSQVTGGTIAQRLSFYRSALEAFAQHPVLGLGLGGWSEFYSMDNRAGYPHNFLLEVAAEQGIIGVIVLILLLGSIFRSAARTMHHPQYGFLFPVLILNLLCYSFTGSIESRDLWFWLGAVLAGARNVQCSMSNRLASCAAEDTQCPRIGI